MNSLVTYDLLYPILLALIGEAVIIVIIWSLFKRLKILRAPYNGMEWSEVLCIAIFLFGIVAISSTYTNAILQTYKVFKSQHTEFWPTAKFTFNQFAVYFLVVLMINSLFTIVMALAAKMIVGKKGVVRELQDGNISLAILLSGLMMGFTIFFYIISHNIMDTLTPVVINFR